MITPDFIGQIYKDTATGHLWRANSLTAGDWTEECYSPSGAGTPVASVTPNFIGQLYHDTAADSYYRSTGLTNADWTVISGATNGITWTPQATVKNITFDDDVGITSLSISGVTTVTNHMYCNGCSSATSIDGGILETIGDDLLLYNNSDATTISFTSLTSVTNSLDANSCTLLDSFDISNLVSVGLVLRFDWCESLVSLDLSSLETVGDSFYGSHCTLLETIDLSSLESIGDYMDFHDCIALTSFSVPLLTTIGDYVDLSGNVAMASLDLSSLTTVSGGFWAVGCSSLTSVDCPVWIPSNGNAIDLSGCALDATSVNLLLSRCVANAGYISGGINLSGGTNAAPTGQGILDKATLNARLAGLAVTN